MQNAIGPEEESTQKAHWVGPVEFLASNRHHAVLYILNLAKAGVSRHIHLANAYTVALADKSAEYRQVLSQPAINFPDGKPIGWVSAMNRHNPRLEQVRGPQLFLDTFDHGRRFGTKHFLLGSTPQVLGALETNLKTRFPGVQIAGTDSPPFRPLSEDELRDQDERIRASGADIVWVGLGTPKQDFEAQRLATKLPIVAIAIGAAFDFAAGTAREAPRWMTSLGLEWVFRFACEPRRLWRRYFFGNARFLSAAFFGSYAETQRRGGDSL